MSTERSRLLSWRHPAVVATRLTRPAAAAVGAISLTAALLVAAVPAVDAAGPPGQADRSGAPRLVARAGERMVSYPGLAVAWPAPQVSVSSAHAVRGLVSAPGVGATATLQRLVVGVWTDVISTPVAPSGSFMLPLPSFYFGHFSYRLRITAAGVDPVETPALPVAVVPTYRPAGRDTSYALISPSPVGRWDPCTPIGYRVNLAEARQGALRDVQSALARIAVATGLQFRYLGTTDVVPFAGDDPFDPSVADLVVAWTDPASVPGLFQPGNYALGGPEMRPGHDIAGGPVRQIYQGGVTFNSAFNAALKPGSGKGYTRVAALMHELGHAVGLFHVTGDGAEIMSPSLARDRDQWGAGDLAGLEAVGAVNGCVTADSPARGNGSDAQALPTRD
ncbi:MULTISPECIES: hypothetical protein [unclassified Nocardioides]|uniref:hypothetical protein n=1 Tax=unclassified Nocardioides TaxID=2615069 RepID=UPI0009F153AD|nr:MULTISPECIES: hypothetical protein [unclassified Nocardioides]GAW48112.1 uncharacterized protein (Precursor) [Nocardioides sp. PD653-B2]GAW53585.1 uncharacterized protein (Precursor) [Nocardioides sp. PD653]